MTHHIVTVERVRESDGTAYWRGHAVDMPIVADRLCKVEETVRFALQMQFGSAVQDDTIEVRIGAPTRTFGTWESSPNTARHGGRGDRPRTGKRFR